MIAGVPNAKVPEPSLKFPMKQKRWEILYLSALGPGKQDTP